VALLKKSISVFNSFSLKKTTTTITTTTTTTTTNIIYATKWADFNSTILATSSYLFVKKKKTLNSPTHKIYQSFHFQKISKVALSQASSSLPFWMYPDLGLKCPT